MMALSAPRAQHCRGSVLTLEVTVTMTAALTQAKGTLVWRGAPAESVGVFERLVP